MQQDREQKHIVVLDDDANLRLLIAEYLESHNLRVTLVASGAELDRVMDREHVDVLILDVMMPGEDGITVLKRLSAKKGAPAVLMLSAMASDVDRILGLEIGADDYIGKPANPRELLARVRAILRRQALDKDALSEEQIAHQGWVIDPASHTVIPPDGQMIDLTKTEFRILLALSQRSNRVVDRDTLTIEVHGDDADLYDRAIDVGISRLRAKLSAHGGASLIRTVRGEGYMFVRRP